MGNTKSITPAGSSTSSTAVVAPPKIVKGGDHDMPLWALAVSEYLPWETRREVMFLSKSWYRNTTTLAYYRFLCQRLAHECGVYIPVTPPAGDTWRTLFYDLYHLRNLWKAKPLELIGTTQKEHAKRSKISVYAKFRPNQPALTDKKDANAAQRDGASESDHQRREPGVTLPLHQKLAMIRMSHNIKSNRRALRLLTEEGSWFSAKWEALSDELATANELTLKDVGTAGASGDAENDENSPHNTPSSSSSAAPAASFTTREGRSQNRRLLALTAARRRAAAERGGHGTDALQARRKEQQQQMVSKVHSLDALSGRVVMLTPDVGLREFLFDGVLTGTSSQSYAYELSTKRLIMDLLNGFNATAIVYGQTGSGKTYSMFGKDEASAMGRDRDGKGIIPRACEELLQAVDQRQRYHGIDSELYVSYVEVFGDQVSDLLRQGQRCGHSKVAAQRYVLNGAAEYRVQSMRDIEDVLRIGEQQKRRAATAMNERSTRAHSLFIVTLKQRKAPTLLADATLATHTSAVAAAVTEGVTLTTRLFLADLGGSEQVKKSQVEAGQHRLIERDGGDAGQTTTTATTGPGATAATFSVGFQKAERMREAVNINLGLLALKKCIEALNQNSPYVPYQDSKLTMLLSEGLGGNCKTSIIVCANLDTAHASETVASLRFGERCARIETAARNNATILAGILADLDARITALEQAILQKERWEVREVRREDVLAEDGTLEKALGGQEIIKQTVVVGAEQERVQLAQLLLQRQQFAGIRRPGGGDVDEADDLWGDEDVDGAALAAATSAAAATTAATATSAGGEKSTRRRKVLGFGRSAAAVYGFGDTYDENAELVEENDRFAAHTSAEALPKVLRRARRGVAWAQGDMGAAPADSESFQQEVRKANKIRAKLAYSGISA